MSLLDKLRAVSQVSCDTLDYEVAKTLGPFRDATSNQAIAAGELTKLHPDGTLQYDQLLRLSAQDAQEWLHPAHPEIDLAVLTVEIMMVRLSLQFAPFVTDYLHIQTNPQWAYSKEKTAANGERIVQIYQKLKPGFDRKKVCIKIPATWEGIAACQALESKGIATLATTLFCMEQAALAASAGCTYIAPYVNELKVHFVPGYVDPNKAFDFCRQAQAYFAHKGMSTQVLAASLTSIEEVMQLTGVHQITVSPPLLKELAETSAPGWRGADGAAVGAYFTNGPDGEVDAKKLEACLKDESLWRLSFTRNGGGVYEGKLIQAINIFSDKQDALEALAQQYLQKYLKN